MEHFFGAIKELYDSGIERIDSFNLIGCINRNPRIKSIIEKEFTDDAIIELIEKSPIIARATKEDYDILVKTVSNLSFRRELYKNLSLTQKKCLNESINVEDLIKDVNEKNRPIYNGARYFLKNQNYLATCAMNCGTKLRVKEETTVVMVTPI